MSAPRPISARELALRAQHESETLPRTGPLLRHDPEYGRDLGRLPERVSTFRPPLPSLSGLVRASGHPTRPAGRGEQTAPRHRPGLEAPEGVVHFSRPRTPQDAQAMRRLGRDLLQLRPGSSAPVTGGSVERTSATAVDRPSLGDCRRDLSEFRSAMSDFQRARYFGGDDRHAVASAALQRAEAAYQRLYANLPLTPSMSGILENLDGRIAGSRTELATMAPRGRSRRHA